jgi:putative phage-type endonuclease
MTERSQFLGSTDAPAVLGISPWKTRFELWQEKTGRAERPKIDARKRRILDRGHRLEPFIRDMTIDKLADLGIEAKLLACNERYSDPKRPYLSAEIDFELELSGEALVGDEIITFDREHINVDAKSVSSSVRRKWGSEGTDEIPIEYAAQFMHALGVTGRRVCLAAALMSFDDVDLFWQTRDDETIEAMRSREVHFWHDNVLADRAPPPIDFSDVKLMFPRDDATAIEATPGIAEAVRQYAEVKARIKALETDAEAIQTTIGAFMETRQAITIEGQRVLSWKAQEDRRLDQGALREAYPDLFNQFMRTKVIRVMRLHQPKKSSK